MLSINLPHGLLSVGLMLDRMQMKIHTSVEGFGLRSRTSAICCQCGDSKGVVASRDESSEIVCCGPDSLRWGRAVGVLHYIRVVRFALLLLPLQGHRRCGDFNLSQIGRRMWSWAKRKEGMCQ